VTPRPVLIALAVFGLLVVAVEARRSPDASQESGAASRGGIGSIAWSDEFNGRRGKLPNPTKWSLETGYGWGDGELQSYTDRRANVSLDGKGHLAIIARRERYTGPDGRTARFTSARMNTRAKFEFAYGRIEARIRMPAGRGLLPAFWAAGSNIDRVGWPEAGEIDVVEVNGSEPFTAHGTLHGPRDGHEYFSIEASRQMRTALAKRFHLYGVSWSPGRIAFLVDGKVYGVKTPAALPSGARWSFDSPFFLLFTLAVGPRWLGPPDSTTPWPATMLVDWVRLRLGRATFCPTVRTRRLRPRCPRHPDAADSSAGERAQ
jgi:beta-glucanase (GH16 family)